MKSFLTILSWLAVIATLTPLLRGDAWWIRSFDFPRIQITVIAVCLVAVMLLIARDLRFYDSLTIVAVIASIALQAWQIFPYTVFAPVQVQASGNQNPVKTFRLFVANVRMDNREVTGLKKQIRETDPDTILIVEPNAWWETELRSLQSNYGYSVTYPIDNTYGMILYSRLQLIDPQVRFLVQENVPSIRTRVKLRSGTELVLHCVHPKPPSPTEHPRSTERDAELILVGKEVRNSKIPAVVAGDLNDVAWSYTTRLFQKISGLLDPRVGRGIFGTFHARYPISRWPLDHVFHSNHFRLKELRTLDYFGSDHLPVLVVLSYEPAAKIAQDEFGDPNQGERSEMHETVTEATRDKPND